MRNKQKKRAGFTIIEVLIIIVVIAILASIILPRLKAPRAEAQRAACLSNLRNLQTLLEINYSKSGGYPNSLADLSDNEGIRACPVYGPYTYTLEEENYAVVCQGHKLKLTADGFSAFADEDDEGDEGGGDDELPDYPQWESQTYEQGAHVIHDGRVFYARYYAKPEDIPGELGSPWQEITDEWRHFNVYEQGDIVIYEGRQFQARNWSQNQQPGLVTSPWQELTDEWRFFNVYEIGAEVWHKGKKYRAKFWSQNREPGVDPAWEEVG